MEVTAEIICLDPTTLDKSKYTTESLKVLLEARGFPSVSDDFEHLWEGLLHGQLKHGQLRNYSHGS